MEKITNYILLSTDDERGLTETMRAYLSEGFQPYGTPFGFSRPFDDGTSEKIICQAVVKYESQIKDEEKEVNAKNARIWCGITKSKSNLNRTLAGIEDSAKKGRYHFRIESLTEEDITNLSIKGFSISKEPETNEYESHFVITWKV